MLRYKADRRSLVFVGIYYAALISSWIFWPDAWYFNAAITLSLCVLSFICAVITHNTVHAPIFRKKELNKIFQLILSFAYGHSVSAYVPGHNFSHHQHTQTSKDRIRTTNLRFKCNLFNQLLFFFWHAPGIMRDEAVFAGKMLQERPRWFYQYLGELIIVLGIKLTLLVMDPLKAICLIFIPHLYAAWGIVGTNFWQHDGCDKTHAYNHSRTFTSPWLNFIAFNNGYHGAHHEKPHLHWSLLPEYHRIHIQPHLHPNLNRNSLFAYLWEICVWPGKRVDYMGIPLILPIKTVHEDWIEDLSRMKQENNLGVEN
ncbi:MAG: fatty acid desaturase [Verrucomicrobiae bacterium]|nr:fatty acid desaturase [Verrucomicrobiae bacterium]